MNKFKVGDVVECTHVGQWEKVEGLTLGDVPIVTSVRERTGSIRIELGKSMWMSESHFELVRPKKEAVEEWV